MLLPMRWKRAAGASPGRSPDDLAVLPPAARAPVLERLAVVAPDGVLDEAVALDPAALFPASELLPDLRREPGEQVEERRGVPADERAGEAERLPAGVDEDAGGDALGGPSSFVLVRLVADEQVEEGPQAVLDVVREGVALRPRVVRLPERGAAVVAGALAAGEVLQGQRQAVLVDDRGEAVRAAGHPERLPASPRPGRAFRPPSPSARRPRAASSRRASPAPAT